MLPAVSLETNPIPMTTDLRPNTRACAGGPVHVMMNCVASDCDEASCFFYRHGKDDKSFLSDYRSSNDFREEA